MTLSELIERVEKATGSDRELDRDIAVAAGVATEKSGTKGLRRGPTEGPPSEIFFHSSFFDADPYTASIDAALDLVEKCLPGHAWLIGVGKDSEGEPPAACQILDGFNSSSEIIGEAEAQTVPLATVLALLRALHSKEQAE